jgi:AraC family transcriptional regulator, positive regulator of tynA and feaB
MSEDGAGARAPAKLGVEVWDTQYLPPSQGFGVFREGLCTAFMPWSIDSEPLGEFDGRIESVILESGSVARVRMTPVVAARTKADVSNSTAECIYGNFVLAGELHVEQRGRSNVARQGDVILYDSAFPLTLKEQHDHHYEDLPFMIPKSELASIKDLENVFGNVVLRRDSLIRPLSSSLAFLAENISSLSRVEVAGLFDACVSLLPVAVGYAERERNKTADIPQASPMLRAILDFVNRHISSADLSPQAAADNLGITVRYVHKLFAAKHMTFGSYVTSKRLDLIRKDLISPSCRYEAISILAYRWGFNELSTFNRSFKQRYGIPPSQYRASVSN